MRRINVDIELRFELWVMMLPDKLIRMIDNELEKTTLFMEPLLCGLALVLG